MPNQQQSKELKSKKRSPRVLKQDRKVSLLGPCKKFSTLSKALYPLLRENLTASELAVVREVLTFLSSGLFVRDDSYYAYQQLLFRKEDGS